MVGAAPEAADSVSGALPSGVFAALPPGGCKIFDAFRFVGVALLAILIRILLQLKLTRCEYEFSEWNAKANPTMARLGYLYKGYHRVSRSLAKRTYKELICGVYESVCIEAVFCGARFVRCARSLYTCTRCIIPWIPQSTVLYMCACP